MTSKENNFEGQSPLLPPETLASLAVLPGSEEAQRMTVTSGRRCLESYAKSGPLGSLEKILLGDSRWTSTVCYLTWRARAMKRGHLLFQLVPSTPHIEEIGYILLPTMTTTDSHGHGYQYQNGDRNKRTLTLAGVVKLLPTPRAGKMTGENEESWQKRHQEGKVATPPLELAVKMLPTPGAGDARHGGPKSRFKRGNPHLTAVVAMLHTPKARDWKGQSQRGRHSPKDALPNTIQFQDGQKTGLKLQPHFVEWMMGFPIGWLDLKPSEIPRSRSKSSPSCGA